MGKARDLFRKIRDTKRIFHAKMGTIKDRNSVDLTEAEDIKKRWQEHIEELYKKDLHDPDNHNGVITHLEPDILECEVKRALGTKIVRRNINNLDMQMANTLTAESEEELKSLLVKVKEETEKLGLKLNIQKTKIMASGPVTSWQIDRETVETVADFCFLGLPNYCRW